MARCWRRTTGRGCEIARHCGAGAPAGGFALGGAARILDHGNRVSRAVLDGGESRRWRELPAHPDAARSIERLAPSRLGARCGGAGRRCTQNLSRLAWRTGTSRGKHVSSRTRRTFAANTSQRASAGREAGRAARGPASEAPCSPSRDAERRKPGMLAPVAPCTP